jgi:Domain of unknown function (DUF4266)
MIFANPSPDHSCLRPSIHIIVPMRILVLLLAVLLCGCSEKLCRVKQYQRGRFARISMADTTDPVHKAMTEHAYFSREASYGGSGVGGGGCGCN